jgi:hypothetical protein
MKEFDSFLKNLFLAELFVFSLTFSLILLTEGFGDFAVSYLIGYGVAAFDLFLLARFSYRLPELVKAGYYPRSGFLWRFASISLILVGVSLFTQVNFFAIISAVAAANAGLFGAVILRRKEWRKWNTEA